MLVVRLGVVPLVSAHVGASALFEIPGNRCFGSRVVSANSIVFLCFW